MDTLAEEQILKAPLDHLVLWSWERNLPGKGTIEEIQQRLIRFSELQGEPQLFRPAEFAAPPAKPSRVRILVSLLLLFIIVGVAGGVGWWVANALPGSIVGEEPLTTEPDEPTISFAEQSYLTRMGALANDYVNAVEGFSAAVADYVEGYFGVSYTLEVIDGYIVDINEVYFSLLPLEPPCLAYSSMHDNTLTGVDLTTTAMESTYDGILFDDISYLSDAADYMEDANVYLQSALGELQGLGNTAPNCS